MMDKSFAEVSIIIPAYNAEIYIERTLSKILRQTWKNLQIIIVDDGSTDRTNDIVKNFINKKNAANIILITSENRGAAHARNEGIKYSTGKYIQFLDADDYLSDDKIANQLSLIECANNPESAIVFCKYENDYGNHVKAVNNKIIEKDYEVPSKLLINFWKFSKFNVIHSYLIPRKLVEIAGGWDETLTTNDDGEFMSRVILKSDKILFDKKSTAFYVFIKGSLSKAKSYSHYLSRLSSYTKIKTNYTTVEGNEEEFNKLYNQKVANCLIEIFSKDWQEFKILSSIFSTDLAYTNLILFKMLKMFFTIDRLRKIYTYNVFRLDNRIS